jgi:hypothetical protein
MEGKQRTYLMLAMETLAKEDWQVNYNSHLVLHLYSLFPAWHVLPLFSFAFVYLGKGVQPETRTMAMET